MPKIKCSMRLVAFYTDIFIEGQNLAKILIEYFPILMITLLIICLNNKFNQLRRLK